ncbi:CmpA/NrtA family ABC transporter substrate-binding protein [Acidithiobacillus thiooxidans]|uniref:CmpA/NrtA family ABC transporter substrate-binding protein n=1 Tax=Acidithiobacillus thiooxidans TaxID=930 RepID=UPI0035667900
MSGENLNIGFVALTDSAPLIVARELGFFAAEGLAVTLQKEPSWASLRDHLLFGDLVAAHALAPLPMAATLGIASPKIPVSTALTLSLNGNAITVSHALHQRLRDTGFTGAEPAIATAQALRHIIETEPAKKLRFAVVSPVSNHHYQLRHWLRAASIDPDQDIQITVVPPRHMVAALRAGEIDGYCVGEPWGSLAAAENVGIPIISSYELWNNLMEKVLAVRNDWSQREPDLYLAMIRAILTASQWLDNPQHRLEAAPWVAAAIGVPREVVAMALTGNVPGLAQQEDFHVFARYSANFPWHSHALWLARQMQTAGQWPQGVDSETLIPQVYRCDIYRQAANALRLPVPNTDFVDWGNHTQSWQVQSDDGHPVTMGPNLIFDGSTVTR